MWKLLTSLFGRSQAPATTPAREPRDVESALQAIDQGAAEHPLPTLVCRKCGLKYANTGTYLQGAKCPDCFPGG